MVRPCVLFPLTLYGFAIYRCIGWARSGTESNSSGELCSDDDEEEQNDEDDGEMKIHVQDETQINNIIVALLHTIYFTIMYSLSFEECAHKMLQMSIKPGQELRWLGYYARRTLCIAIGVLKLLWTLLSCNLKVLLINLRVV